MLAKNEENEDLVEKVTALDKENIKLKSELKDTKVYNQCISDELKTLKESSKEKEHELRSIKSDCAAALLSKEKTLQEKVLRLENLVSDLKFENQKYVQQLHNKET